MSNRYKLIIIDRNDASASRVEYVIANSPQAAAEEYGFVGSELERGNNGVLWGIDGDEYSLLVLQG